MFDLDPVVLVSLVVDAFAIQCSADGDGATIAHGHVLFV
jgi:hypothetical protein